MRLSSCLLALLVLGSPAFPQVETARSVSPRARAAMLTLSLSLSRQAAGGAELLRFSDLSARLSMMEGPVPQAALSGYAQSAAQLVEATIAAGAPALEAAAPLQALRQALSDRLEAADLQRLDSAHRRLTEVRSDSALSHARALARALLPQRREERLAQAPLRPPIEWWTVGGRRFGSTAELLQAHSQSGATGGLAVYHYRHAQRLGWPRTRRLAGLSSAALSLGFFTALFALITATMGWTVFPASAVVAWHRLPAIFRFIFFLAATFTLARGWNKGVEANARAEREGTTLSGTLRLYDQPSGRSVLFIPERPDALPADLAVHAEAPLAQASNAEGSSDDVFFGAAGMLLILSAALLPLFLGDALAVAVVSMKHSVLGRRLGVPALGLGAGAGLVLVAQAFLFIGAGQGWWIALVGAAAVGALWGKLVFPRLRAAEAAEDKERGQWWQAR